jgi:hypothetical protein
MINGYEGRSVLGERQLDREPAQRPAAAKSNVTLVVLGFRFRLKNWMNGYWPTAAGRSAGWLGLIGT